MKTRPALVRPKGEVTDAAVAQALRARLCGTVNDPSLSEAGSARRGDLLWIVLASPFAPPPEALGFLDHRGHDGSTPAERVRRAGYKNLGAVAENIAGGAMTAREVLDGWLASPAHCANLMDGAYTEMGIAYAVDDDSPLGIYWAQDFARAGSQN